MEGGRLEAVRPMRGELSILCGVDDGLHQCGMCDEHDNHKGIVSLPYTARTMPEIYSECLIYILTYSILKIVFWRCVLLIHKIFYSTGQMRKLRARNMPSCRNVNGGDGV